jgi:hypothetical protein
VAALACGAVDEIRRQEWNTNGHSVIPGGMWIKDTRWALVKYPARLTDRRRLALPDPADQQKALPRLPAL